MLDLPTGTVKSRMRLGLLAMRRALIGDAGTFAGLEADEVEPGSPRRTKARALLAAIVRP